MKKFESLLLIGTLFLSVNASAQEKFLLEYKYIKGKTYRYQEDSKYQSVQEISGQEIKATGSTFSLMKMIVQDVSDSGDLTIISSLQDYWVTSKSPYMDTTMVMKDLLNRDIQMVISKKGKMMGNKLLDTVKTGKDFIGKGDALFNVYKEIVRFPDKVLKMGDTWQDERTDTTKGTQMVTRTEMVYTLLGIEEKNGHTCLKTVFKGKTEIGGKMNQMGMEFFMEGSGETSGTLWFDKETSIIISKESTNDQDMTMALTGQMQMTIPITSTTTSKFTLIE
jgi:hypothetical protein